MQHLRWRCCITSISGIPRYHLISQFGRSPRTLGIALFSPYWA